jgi:non-ribosomal peptide synthase protein (TIGR01720 family)
LDVGRPDFARVRIGGDAAGDVIKRVKEQLRAVPGDGLGFGLLRYLNAETGPVLAARPVPRLGFNYLGRFGGGPASGDGDGPTAVPGAWRLGAMGGDADPGMRAPHPLEATGAVRDLPGGPDLSLSLSWAAGALGEGDVQELKRGWLDMLAGFAAHATAPGTGGHTPSDFPLAAISQDDLGELESKWGNGK